MGLKTASALISKRNLHNGRSVIHKSQDMETILSTNRWMGQEVAVWDMDRMEGFSPTTKKGSLLFYNSLDEPWKHYAKCKKPVTKGHRLCQLRYMKKPRIKTERRWGLAWVGDENVLKLWEWLPNCGYSKATEFVLQMDELYAVKLHSVKLSKDKRHPIHKKSQVWLFYQRWPSRPCTLYTRSVAQAALCPPYFNSASSQNSATSPQNQ